MDNAWPNTGVLLRAGLVRFAPVPRELAVQFVHADDVPDLITRILSARAAGPVNVRRIR